MYFNICNAVYNLIDDNKTYLKINKIYNYDKAVIDEWFPSCTIMPAANTATILDNSSYQIQIPVQIRIMWDFDSLNTKEGQIRTTADDIIKLLINNYILNGLAINCDLAFQFWYTWDPAYRTFEIIANYTIDQSII